MLGKLLGYDFKRLADKLSPVLFVMLFSGCAAGALAGMEQRYIQNGIASRIADVVFGLLVLVTAACFVASKCIIYVRYYGNLMGREAYFTRALPVTSGQHVCSKLISAVIWRGFSTLLFILSVAGGILIASFISNAAAGKELYLVLALVRGSIAELFMGDALHAAVNIGVLAVRLISAEFCIVLLGFLALTKAGTAKRAKTAKGSFVYAAGCFILIAIYILLTALPEMFGFYSTSFITASIPSIILSLASMLILFAIISRTLDKKLF